ncbi:DNA helicase RecQ [Clostridium senegalense]|uniref:DNA helicase RecQ n=1 Tax=Clostridium senegalense TaxID=1465809 RepID=UPI001C114E3F|nr:DNA helicase RecQ [Clostridium senegalense]MBU5225230.1 DNA helicase RecQ [Clostridium senegalense]
MINKALEVLNKYFGYNSFRKGQENVIHSILNGNDTVAIMPTGGGKSICYQLPAILFDGITIVVSPLISLMKDQVDNLKATGISAGYINSSLSSLEYKIVKEKILNNNLKILYVAPERLLSQDFITLISNVNVPFIAIDEAHCVSQWGHDFRSSYTKINEFINLLKTRPTVAAFTATATEEVKNDMVKLLHLNKPSIFITGFDRENLILKVVQGGNKETFILNYLKTHKEDSGIIYCATRKEVESLWELLNNKDITALKYHAGLSDNERLENQESFLYDNCNIIIATNAFGMGIDKSNVRFVIHHNMPKNIESYYQEIGRAGRDGEESECILLFSQSDIHLQKYLIDVSTYNENRKLNEYNKLQLMADFSYSNDCLKKFILNYFGENYNQDCGKCSNCHFEGEFVDKTEEARNVLYCVYEMKRPLGVTSIIDILKGSKNKKVLRLGLDKLNTYGIMSNVSKDYLKTFIHTLISHRYLESLQGNFPTVGLTEKSIPILKREESVIFKEFVNKEYVDANNELLTILKSLRRDIANDENIPPYVVFSDSTLKELSIRLPINKEELLDISGIGEHKCEKYGTIFLNAINTYVNENNITLNFVFTKTKNDSQSKGSSHKGKTIEVTMDLLSNNPSIENACKQRNLQIGTILEHIKKYLEEHESTNLPLDFSNLYDENNEKEILDAIKQVGRNRLKPIKEIVNPNITYDEIKVVIFKNYFVS